MAKTPEDLLIELLETNCQWVEREAPKLAAGGDLQPMLILVPEDGIPEIHMAQWGSAADKDAVITRFSAMLRAKRAIRYGIIAAAWMVQASLEEGADVEAEIREHGTERYADRRIEVYQLSVGDRQRCLFTVLKVERNWRGKIVKLTRTKIADADENAMRGRMVNLLRTVN